jgi:hypothetical protein
VVVIVLALGEPVLDAVPGFDELPQAAAAKPMVVAIAAATYG